MDPAIVLYNTMTSYSRLLLVRPKRKDLYDLIALATGTNRIRLMYSYALDFVRLGNNTIFPRQGLPVSIPLLGLYGIFSQVPSSLMNADPVIFQPVVDSENALEDFIESNLAVIESRFSGFMQWQKIFLGNSLVILVPISDL